MHNIPMHNQIKKVEVKVYPDGRLDTHNASLYSGFSEKTLAMMRSEGRGPKFIKRGRIFYYLEDIDAWFNSATRQLTTAQLSN